jgi:Raf kinase inhibitor-like YbhB/YbcL family protein
MPALAVALGLFACPACAAQNEPETPQAAIRESRQTTPEAAMRSFRITSTAFTEGRPIPARYTADGDDVSPPLEVHDPPDGTQSLVLIMDDPDAPVGTWVHWVVWRIPVQTREIRAGELPSGAVEGRNSWGRTGYGGPAPPSGTHRYFFKLLALDILPELPPTTDKAALLRAVEGHVLGQAQLMGTYSRGR